MQIKARTKEKIFAMADALYRETDEECLPTVAMVQELAKTDYQTTFVVMQEWRKANPSPVHTLKMKTIYRIPAPYSLFDMIEVYGDPENGWYEWRIVSKEGVLQDTKDLGYGSPEIALRDALIATSTE